MKFFVLIVLTLAVGSHAWSGGSGSCDYGFDNSPNAMGGMKRMGADEATATPYTVTGGSTVATGSMLEFTITGQNFKGLLAYITKEGDATDGSVSHGEFSSDDTYFKAKTGCTGTGGYLTHKSADDKSSTTADSDSFSVKVSSAGTYTVRGIIASGSVETAGDRTVGYWPFAQEFTVTDPPAITGSDTAIANDATTLIIAGSGFDATTPGNNAVEFMAGTAKGTATCAVTASTAVQLTCTISGAFAGAGGAIAAKVTVDSLVSEEQQVATVTAAACTTLPATTAGRESECAGLLWGGTCTQTCSTGYFATGSGDYTCVDGTLGGGDLTCTACMAVTNCNVDVTCTASTNSQCATCDGAFFLDNTGAASVCTACRGGCTSCDDATSCNCGDGKMDDGTNCVDCDGCDCFTAEDTCNADDDCVYDTTESTCGLLVPSSAQFLKVPFALFVLVLTFGFINL